MGRRRALSEEDIKEIFELREKADLSRNKIASMYGISENVIYLLEKGKLYKDILKKLGRKHESIRKSIGEIKLNNRKLNEKNIIEVYKLYNSNIGIKDIAEKFDVSYSSIYQIIKGRAYRDIIEKYNLKAK